MANIFTSDLHWFHKNICNFSGRPWEYKDNTNRLIEIWNENVGKKDTCWHLGDTFFLGHSEAHVELCLEVIEQLNGTPRFIMGNHDPSRLWNKLLPHLPADSTVDKYKEIKLNKTKICLFHYPQVVWNQSHRGSIQLHGHCHGSLHNLGKSIDVGLDGANERLGAWRFWTEQDVLDYAEKLTVYSPDHHETGGNG